jgi:hypothetical protein
MEGQALDKFIRPATNHLSGRIPKQFLGARVPVDNMLTLDQSEPVGK